MATYRVTRRGRRTRVESRPSPLDWPRVVVAGLENLCWAALGGWLSWSLFFTSWN